MSPRAKNRRQAYLLLLFGVIFLSVAELGILNPYPVGEVCFGLGMLAAAPLNPHRFLIAGWLTTLIGLAGFLVFGHLLPGNQILATHVLAIGLGLLGIGWMTHRRYIRAGTLTPPLLVIGVGVVEFLQAAHLTPDHFLSFALSPWLPGFGLLALGLVALVVISNPSPMSKRCLGNSLEAPVLPGNTALHSRKEGAR